MGINTLITNKLQDFGQASVLDAADRVKLLYETTEKQKFVNRFLLPTPCWAYYRIHQLIQQYPQLEQLKPGMIMSPVLCVFSGVVYCFMWIHLLPLVVALLIFIFNTSAAERLLQSQFNEHTFRSIVLVLAEVGLATWALSTFHLTETFETKYDSLQRTFSQKWDDALVKIKVSQELTAMKPELIKNFIDKANLLLLASDDFSQQQQDKILNLITQAMADLDTLSIPIAPTELPNLHSSSPPELPDTLENDSSSDSSQDVSKRTYGEDPFSDSQLEDHPEE